MFALSIALFALALILALFGLVGVAGASSIVGSMILLGMAVGSMFAYWRRRARTA